MRSMVCQSESVCILTPVASWKQGKFTQVYSRRGLGMPQLRTTIVLVYIVITWHFWIPLNSLCTHQIILHLQHSLAFPWQAQLSEGQELQPRCSLIATQCKATQQHSLCQGPRVKRVWAYQNGGQPDDGTYAWASTISEVNLMWISNRPGIRPQLWHL